MSRKPASFWTGLLIHGLDHNTAISAFDKEYANDCRLYVQHPIGGNQRLMALDMNLGEDREHFLFKGPDDDHGRANRFSRLPAEFRPECAECLGFIREVLRAPEAIYESKELAGEYIYTSATLPGEDFIVVLRLPKRGDGWFVTAYPTERGRAAKDLRSRKVWPRGKRRKKKQK